MKGWKDYRIQGAEYVPIDALRPYEHNAKEHPEWQVDQIVESIKSFGMRRRIGVWENPETHELTVTTGHGQLLACQKLGFTEVPIERDSDLNDSERRMWTHTDNQANANSGIDLEILNADLEEIGGDYDLEALGFEGSINADDFSEEFSLPDGDKSEICQMTFTVHERQKELIEYAMNIAKDRITETFGNVNQNGNALYEVVREWAERRK